MITNMGKIAMAFIYKIVTVAILMSTKIWKEENS